MFYFTCNHLLTTDLYNLRERRYQSEKERWYCCQDDDKCRPDGKRRASEDTNHEHKARPQHYDMHNQHQTEYVRVSFRPLMLVLQLQNTWITVNYSIINKTSSIPRGTRNLLLAADKRRSVHVFLQYLYVIQGFSASFLQARRRGLCDSDVSVRLSVTRRYCA